MVACPAHFKANKINTFLNKYSIESFNLPIFISNSNVLCYYAQSYFSRCFLKKAVTINPQNTSTMFPDLQIQPINLLEEEQWRCSKAEATNKNKSLPYEQILFDSVLLPGIGPGFHIIIWIKSSSDNACLLWSICRAGSRFSWGKGITPETHKYITSNFPQPVSGTITVGPAVRTRQRL